MNLNITGHHLEITPAIREYTASKFDKIKRHFDNVECDDDNLYAAIDNLVDTMDRQVIKHKEKLSDRRHGESGKHNAVAE
jgi:putative sigma-54 modulation protein